jgi:DNA-binding transcriptional ArsR family regulator
MKKQLSDEALEMIASRFKLLSDPMRLRILHTLGREEMTVSELVEATNGGQANISKHLGALLEAGIVARRKEGLNAFYKVSDETIFDLCEMVCNRLESQFDSRKNMLSGFVSPK